MGSTEIPDGVNLGTSFEDDAANGAGGERLKDTSVFLLDDRHLLPSVDSVSCELMRHYDAVDNPEAVLSKQSRWGLGQA